MPGFTSFILGHGHFTSFKPDSPPPSDYDSEPETAKSKKRRLQEERRRAKQVSSFYDTTQSRANMEKMLGVARSLYAEISAQIDLFHDLGLVEEKGAIIREFETGNGRIIAGAKEILDRFEKGGGRGVVKELEAGAAELRRVVTTGSEGDAMDRCVMLEVLSVYRMLVIGPVKQMKKDMKTALRKKKGWTDPK
ncbi:hypothetical protein PtrSN002B_008955 [Pyrenophora tritici-repentis]|uniref:Atrophin-1 multi-domain protein n=2 Tax=Pyrenophora tritici-repentis TaxID=45151 RepID=A0A2W1DJE9_9PLEO|nr:uncharacterized protein PTRG_08012 [Pyrenophora tritici-repentis Pt-1C-BFP]KAA8616644.1 hypothetical protein PtrV1_09945 [Pyrenophora tritici-repentis]EDU50931.1 predicted protein [Pyrenophora tritici-repentis Pt-1C-BFP]KAF7445940.1 hypothetical protein A1F99_092310 [Pyrenophora tritici-repentis]KAF7567035.1 Atrophin-1 multi-domain protein [Pyrenophora tritici-repentis]KAG9381649.1 hypothetical protein A1F94_007303 [Pyrenophora tritici-repentis]